MAGTLQILRRVADAARDAADNFERVPAALERTVAVARNVPTRGSGGGGGDGSGFSPVTTPLPGVRPRVRVNLDGTITPLPPARGSGGGSGGGGSSSSRERVTVGLPDSAIRQLADASARGPSVPTPGEIEIVRAVQAGFGQLAASIRPHGGTLDLRPGALL